jgi:hypothetical protein
MSAKFTSSALAVVSVVVACGLQTACELLVQLDRSASEPADAGCPICTSLSDDDAGDGGRDGSLSGDVAAEASTGEAGE